LLACSWTWVLYHGSSHEWKNKVIVKFPNHLVRQRIVELKNSVIGKYFLQAQGDTNLPKESQFRWHSPKVPKQFIASKMRHKTIKERN